jgi:uncharacterized Tic20 family protein
MSEPTPESANNISPGPDAPADSALSPSEPGKLPTAKTQDDKTFGMIAHLLGAFTGILGPLIIWLIKREQSKFVDDQGKEALNFQILILILHVAAGATFCFTVGALNAVVGILSLAFSVVGGLEANKGVAYRYPFNIRLIK